MFGVSFGEGLCLDIYGNGFVIGWFMGLIFVYLVYYLR